MTRGTGEIPRHSEKKEVGRLTKEETIIARLKEENEGRALTWGFLRMRMSWSEMPRPPSPTFT